MQSGCKAVLRCTHRTTPTIKLLESRSARGSGGSEIRLQSWIMLAVSTERRGSDFKVDLEPSVAASLKSTLWDAITWSTGNITHHSSP
jgi:hypothetical protein